MVTVIKKPTGSTHPFYEYACLSTDVKPISLVPENSLCREIDTGKKFYFSDGAWHEAPGRGGSSGGGGLPEPIRSGNILQVSDGTGEWEQVVFPRASEDNDGKVIGIKGKDGVYRYAAVPAPSGGGGEKFVVTLTEENDTWTADKTIAEIVAADAANKVVVAKFPRDGMYIELPLSAAVEYQGIYGALFIGFANSGGDNKIVAVQCANQGSGDVISVTQQDIPTSTNAPLIVTVGDGETAGTLVGDKTYSEVNTAIRSGKTVVLNVDSDTANYHTSVYVISCALSNNTYYLRVNIGENLAQLSGSANDYVSITMGG